MKRPIAIVGAPTSIGIRPYDDGTMRRLDLAPAALRDQGLSSRLSARDLGDVLPTPYRDFVRPAGRPRNEDGVAEYSRELAKRVATAASDNAFVLLLGGDCSIVLGGLLAARQLTQARVGLIYVDAHADFATPAESRTGSAASMCFGLAVGRGDTRLARLADSQPLVEGKDAVIIGRRDDAEPWYGQDALRQHGVLDIHHQAFRESGPPSAAQAALKRVTRSGISGYWIHVDADVIDPTEVPAVDSPEPNGLFIEELVALLTPLVRHPLAIGLELTIYDPNLDPDRSSASKLATLLERVLGGNRS